MSNQASTFFSCEDCKATFDNSKGLREHVAQHKWGPHRVIPAAEGIGVQFQCLFEGCGKIVKDRKVLRKHCLTHRPREFACEECGKRFYERAKLKRHMLVHTGEKEFYCTHPGCHKTFAYKANLLTHLRTHTGHRPYKCTWPGCTKSFAQASNRNSHVLTHTTNKRKRCTLGNIKNSKAQAGDASAASADDVSLGKQRKVTECGSPRQQQKMLAELVRDKSKFTGIPVSPNVNEQKVLPSISPSHRDTIASLLLLSNAGVQGVAMQQLQTQIQQTGIKTELPPTPTKSLSAFSQAVSGIASGSSTATNVNPVTVPISPPGTQAMSLLNSSASANTSGMLSPSFSSLASLLGTTSASNTKQSLAQPSLLLGPPVSHVRSSLQHLHLLANVDRTNSLSSANVGTINGQGQQQQLLLAAAATIGSTANSSNNPSNCNGASLFLQTLLNRSA